MWKALLKKQFLEMNQYYFHSRKTGKSRGKAGTIAFIGLFVVLFLGIAAAFFGLGMGLASALDAAGLGWLYFALMGLISLALGIFGSVFNTYAGLYHAKDNELLLSMPIPPMQILLARMVVVYGLSLLYSGLVSLPTAVAWWVAAEKVSAVTVVMDLLQVLLQALLVTALTCFLGWIVALISSRLRNKSFVTVLCSLGLLAAYYFVYFKAQAYLNGIMAGSVEAAATTAESLRRWAFPVYAYGRGATGELTGFALFALLSLALFALCCLLMSRNFMKIVTTDQGEKKTPLRESTLAEAKVTDVPKALLRKEWLRFKSSPTYMMNQGLGVVLLPVAAIVLLVKADTLRVALTGLVAQLPQAEAFFPVIATAVVCLISSLNCVTAPSVSLEGKTVWVLQTMPVDPWQVLRAKYRLHLRVSLIPALIAAAAVCYVLQFPIFISFYVVVLSLLFVMFSGCFGLIMNLLKPIMNWTNEVVPVKQSVSVLYALFGGWILAAAMVGVYFLLHKFVKIEGYLLLCIAVMALAVRVMDAWLRNRGAQIFSELEA